MLPPTYFLQEYNLAPVLNRRELYRFVTKIIDSSNKRLVVEKASIREVEFTYLGKKDGLFVYDVFTARVTFNSNQAIQNEQLLKEDIYAFDDIEMGVNDKGEIVKVYNLKQMENQWERRKLELREDNSGYELDDFFNDISNVLRDEEKTLFFLNSKNMFGLYFHGLFGKNDINEVPKKRAATILELNDVKITEEIWTDNRVPEFIIRAQKSNDEPRKIISTNNEIKNYEGILSYNKDSQLTHGFLEIDIENINIKHNVLWVG
jgi:hypothetical protein